MTAVQMEECVFSGDDESQMTSVTYTPRSGEFELSDNFIIVESEEKTNFRTKCDTYETSATFFCRLLSLVYFFSFMADMNQVLGLFGSKGIYDIYLNTTTFLHNLSTKSFYEALSEFPSMYLLIPISDFTLKLVPLVGMVGSFLMFLTGFNCMYSFLSLWLLKLSLVALFKTLPKTVSDLLLLEVGFLAIFIFSPFKFFDKQTNFEVPTLVKWSFRLLAYRVVLLSGVYKVFLLKKVDIQHILMSVPLPTFFNYFLVGVVANFKLLNVVFTSFLIFFEVVLSVFLVTPYRSCRIFGGVSTVVYSAVFTLLGNFGPFYLLLMLSSLFCLDDQFLHPFATWKYNLFSKSDQLMRRVSVDLVDNIFEDYAKKDEANDLDNSPNTAQGSEQMNSARATDNSQVNGVHPEKNNSDNDSENASFGNLYFDRILSNLNYSRHREYIREFMNIENKLSNNLFSECLKKVIKDLLLLSYLTVILCLTVLLFLFRNYRGLKALLLFLFCILLKSHCEAVKTKITFLQGQYTLFILQGLLLFEMLKNGPNTWSFLLWIGLIELQLSLSKAVDNTHYLTKMIIQSFLLTHLLLYNTRIFHSSFKEVLLKPKVDAKVAREGLSYGFEGYSDVNYGKSLNSFYTINNYKNVYPVNNQRFEVVLEGTEDSHVTKSTDWKEYYFKSKPSKLDKFPHFVPFYEYILDDQLATSFNSKYYSKFAPKRPKRNKRDEEQQFKKRYVASHLGKGNYEDYEKEEQDNNNNNNSNSNSNNNGNNNNNNNSNSNNNNNTNDENKEEDGKISYKDKYIFQLIKSMLTGSEDLSRLFLRDPFQSGRPKYVRVLLYKYYFNNIPKKEKSGENKNNWYEREFVTELVPPLSYTPPKTVNTSRLEGEKSSKNNDNDDNLENSSGNFKGNSEENGSKASEGRGAVSGREGTNLKGNNSNNLHNGNGSNFNNGREEHEVMHVVHTMPPADNKTVPLNMAESFNHKIPNVDGIVIASKYSWSRKLKRKD